MKKTIVLGSLGMAGHIMVDVLRSSKKYQVLGVARRSDIFVDKILDVTDFPALESYLKEENPDFVINCVGALISHAEDNITSAILLNSYLPHFLVKVGESVGYKTIHISTDCVFSGKDGSYTENSFRDGDSNYARTKALGEINNDKDLTIRTSIIGPELKENGTGLFDFFLKQKDKVKGYKKILWSGVTALELAKAVKETLDSDVQGVCHLTNNTPISKHELLKLFKIHTGKEIEIEAVDGYESDKTLIDTRHGLTYKIQSYDLMIQEMVQNMKDNTERYPHYLS